MTWKDVKLVFIFGLHGKDNLEMIGFWRKFRGLCTVYIEGSWYETDDKREKTQGLYCKGRRECPLKALFEMEEKGMES